MDVVSDSEEAAGGNEDPGPTNDKEMKKRRNGERTRDRGIRYVQIVSETEFERQYGILAWYCDFTLDSSSTPIQIQQTDHTSH